MTSLYVALRRPEPIAAVLGYSGALLAPELLAAEIKSRPPVLLVHGDADQVVPPRRFRRHSRSCKPQASRWTWKYVPVLAMGSTRKGLHAAASSLSGRCLDELMPGDRLGLPRNPGDASPIVTVP